MRSTQEWIGKNDDARPPPSVRLRILQRNDFKCYLTGIKIEPGDRWDVDHVVALCNGGLNRETNLAPALAGPHRDKTSADRTAKKKDDRVRMKHWGIRKPSMIQSRGFERAAPQRTASRPINRVRP